MISIIIPCFNRENIISETILSVINQSFTDLEILVIDDHSSDNSFQIVDGFVSKDERVKIFRRPNDLPKGGNSCRNFGLQISKGDYVKWLDSDDLLESNALQLQIDDILNTCSDVSLCNSVNFVTDQDFRKTSRWGNLNEEISPSNFVSGSFRWHTCSGLWKRRYFSSEDIWELGLSNSQEWLMHLTQIVKGCKMSIIDDELCLIRVHTESMSSAKNKSGNYYFNEVVARLRALDVLYENRVVLDTAAKKKFFRQIFIYHLFTFYKLNVVGFFYLFLKYSIRIRSILFLYKSK